MRHYRLPFFILSFCVLHLAGTAMQCLADVNKIYVVDIQRIINDSKVGKAAREKVEQEVEQREKKLEALSDSFQKSAEDFEKQRSVMSPDAQKAKMQELAVKEREVQGTIKQEREGMLRRREAELDSVVAKINKATTTIAKEEGYQVVVEKSPLFVVWTNPEFDITDAVLEKVDD